MKMKKYILSIIVFTAALFAGLPVFAEGSKDLYPNGASGGRAYLRASNNASLAFPFPNLGTHFVYAEVGERIALASNAQSGTNKRIYLYNPSGVDVTPTISSGDGNISNRTAELAGPRLPNQTSGDQQYRYTPIYYTVPAGGSGIYKVEFRGTNNNTTGDARLPYSTATSWPSIGNNTYNYLIAWDISVAKQTGSNWAWVPGRVYTNVLNMDNPSYGGNNGNDNDNFRPNSGFYGKFNVLTRDGYVYNVDNNGSQGISFTFMVNNRGFHKVGDANTPSYKSIAAPTAEATQNRYHDPNTADAEAAVTHKIFYNLPDNNMPIEAMGGRPKAGETKTWLRPKQQNLNVTEMTLEGVDGTLSQISNKGGYIKFENNSGGDYTILIAPNINNPDYVATMNFVPRTLTGTSVPGVNNIYFDGKAGDGNMLPQGVIPVEITIKLRGAEVHFPYIDMELNHGGIIIELLKEDYSEVVSDKVYWDDSDIRTITTSSYGLMTNPINASHTAIPAGTSSNTNGHIWGTGSIRTSGTFGDEQGMDTWTFVEGDSHTQGFGVSHRIADLYIEDVSYEKDGGGPIRIGDEITYTVVAGNKKGSCPVEGAPFSFILPPGFVYEGDLSDVTFEPTSTCGSQSDLTYDYDAVTGTGTFHSKLDLAGSCDATGENCEVTYTFKVKVTDQATSANTTATATIMRPSDVTDPDATNTSDPSKPEYTGVVTGSSTMDDDYYYYPTNPFFEVNNNGIENNVSNNIKDNQIPNFIDDIRADNDINQTPVDVPVNGNVLTNDYTSFGTLSVKSAEYYNNSGTLTALSLDSETTIYTPEGVEAGKITLKADGGYIFTPATGFVGSVPVYYTAQNGTNSDDAKLTIKVIPEYDDNDLSNNKPVAHPDAVSTSKNTPITIDPRGNDNNPDGGALTVTEITYSGVAISEDSSNPTEIKDESNNVIGSAYRDGNNLVFTPLNDYIGEVPAFGYTIKNGENATDSSTITITVTETASTAIIVTNDDTNSAPKGEVMTGNVRHNDNWGDAGKNPKITEASVTIGGTTTVLTVGSATSIPGAGTITLNADGSYTYTSDVIGTIPVVYTVKNDDGSEDRATLYLTALNDCMDKVLFFEDFGTSDKDDGNFGRKTSPYMPSGSFAFGTPYPQSTIYDEYEIDNNHYAVVAPGYIKLGVAPNQFYFWTPAYNETGAVTDRSGTEDGAVMVINAGSTLDAFYQRKISVVSGESYRASFWLYLVNGPSQVSIDIMNPATKEVLAVMTSPEMDSAYKHKWTKFELYFTIPADLDCDIDELLLSFRNNKSEYQGNDYYVDDIKLEQVCEVPDGTPTVDVTCPTYAVSIEAIDDFYEVGNNSSVDGNVLDNDISEEGDVLTVTKVIVNGVETTVNPSGTTSFTTSEGGTVVIQPDGSFTYTPPADKNGIFDKFDYIVCNQNNICDDAEVILAVGICYEEVGGKSFKWDYSDGSGVATETINQPVADYGFTFDIYELDNSFNMEINGVKLAVDEIEFQSSGTSGINIEFSDGDQYEVHTQGTGGKAIWQMKGSVANPLIRVVISLNGQVSMYGSKVNNGPLFPLRFKKEKGNKFNKINFSNAEDTTNEITVTQNIVGVTIMEGYGYGRIQVDCPNYWHGYNDNEWAKNSNWTDNYVPKAYEDIVFATATNNSVVIQGMSGPGAGKGAADKDLHLDNVNHNFKDTTTPSGGRIIGDLINKSEKDLVVTTTNQLIIDGKVHGDNTGIIVVTADKDDATGTLIFNKPNDNKNVAAKVEFYNKAFTCPDCGFYRKQWQYFGIPVDKSKFPYLSPQVETINEWMENVDGNKWVNRAANHELEAFRGYEINNSNTTKPTHIYDFSGILNVGDAEVALTKTSNVNYSGMNLIANSFTAAIPISEEAISYSDNSWDKMVYLFNAGTRDQWRKLNGGNIVHDTQSGQYKAVPLKVAGMAGLEDRIPSMHTFMVNAPSTGTMAIAYNELTKNGLVDGIAWRSANTNAKRELPYIVLDVIGDGSADRVWLFEESSTTRGYDNGWDGHKMLEGDLIQVFATDDDHNKYQVTTVPQLDNTTLGIAARENESYTISVAVADDVEVRRLYLHDLFTGRGYLLKNGAEFVISGTRSANQNRFKITSSPIAEAQKGDDAPIINTYVRDNVIVVENRSGENAIVSVYDISGRFVGKAQIAKDEIKSFAELSVGTGVKVVKVVSNSGSINRSDRVLLK